MPLPRLCWFVFSFLACHANVFSRLLVLVLLLIECVHPNSGPPSRRPPPPKRLTSWNCNGIGNSAAELNCYLNNQNVLVACIQETKLSPNSRLPSFPGFAIIRKDWAGGGGGLLTLVHHSVQFSELASPINDNVTEIIVIQLSVADSILKVVNVYIPPVSSCPPGFRVSLSPLLVANTIVLGDVNGHDEEWSLGASDARGDHLADEADSCQFTILNNPDIATRPSSNSSPDVAFIHTPLALSFDWSVSTTLNSDHLPHSLSFSDDSTSVRGGKTYVNLRKAKWEDFQRESEDLFSRLSPPSSCAAGEKEWRRVLQKCSAKHIPQGFHRNYSPGLDATSKTLIAERDERRRQDPNDPEIVGLNVRISASIASNSRQRWMDTVRGLVGPGF